MAIAFVDMAGFQFRLAERLQIRRDGVQIRVTQFHGRHQRAGLDGVRVLDPEAQIRRSYSRPRPKRSCCGS